jgi:hypothetical protein
MYGSKLGPKTRTHFLPSEQYASTLTHGEVQTMGSDACPEMYGVDASHLQALSL